MLRVGQFIQSIDVTSGGTSTAFLNTLAAARTRPGLDVRAYTSPPGPGDPAWKEIEADRERFVLTAGQGRLLGPGPLGRAVCSAIGDGRFDVLHLHGLWSPDLLAAANACRRRGVPYVWEPHGMLVREAYAQKRLKKDVFMALGLRRALTGAGALIFVTAEERDHSLIPTAIERARLHVAPLPVRMPADPAAGTPPFRAQARAQLGIPAAAPSIVFMGRLHPVKRIEMALHALAAMGEKDARLLLIGGGDGEGDPYPARLRALAAELGVGDRVIFAGWVRGEDKWRALAAGDVLTLHSLHENFGFVAVEALCVGTLPVLTKNLAIARELHEGGVGLTCEADAAALAAAWSRGTARNREQPVLQAGRAWVAANLSIEAVGERLEQVYRAVAGAGKGGRA